MEIGQKYSPAAGCCSVEIRFLHFKLTNYNSGVRIQVVLLLYVYRIYFIRFEWTFTVQSSRSIPRSYNNDIMKTPSNVSAETINSALRRNTLHVCARIRTRVYVRRHHRDAGLRQRSTFRQIARVPKLSLRVKKKKTHLGGFPSLGRARARLKLFYGPPSRYLSSRENKDPISEFIVRSHWPCVCI